MSRTIKNIAYAFVGVIIGQVLGSFNSFFLAKILSPADYGIWMTLIMIGSFSPILCFGTVETLLKEYPFLIGKKELNDPNTCPIITPTNAYAIFFIVLLILFLNKITSH